MKKADKQYGYGGDKRERFIDPFLPWFKVITYKKDSGMVVDRYTGDESFVGETITFHKKRPIQGLNYYGFLIGSGKRLGTKKVYDFLKKALSAEGKETPRGIDGFRDEDFVYKNTFSKKKGLIEGEEYIFYKDKLVYTLVYHGGVIEDKRAYKTWKKNLLSADDLIKKLKF